MNEGAVNSIGRLAVEAAAANRISHEELAATPAIIIDGKIVSTESFQPGRSRFRGTFKTAILSAFCVHVNKAEAVASEDANVFVDADTASATAFFNLGSVDAPGHGDWRAQLQLKATAGYAALLAADGRKWSQRELSDWIQDWAGPATLRVKFSEEGVVEPIAKAITAIRAITVKAIEESTTVVRDFGARQSSMAAVEAESEVGIPTHLVFTATPFAGFDSRDFQIRIGVLTSGDKPVLTTKIVSKEVEQESIAAEFATRLSAELGTDQITVGAFSP